MCFVYLYCTHYLCVPLFSMTITITVYSIFFSHNYSLFCSQPFCKHYTYSLDLHNGDFQTTMQVHTRLIKLPLTLACFVLPFYIRTPSVCRTFTNQKVRVIAFSRTLLRPLVYVYSYTCEQIFRHACCYWFACPKDLLVCICAVCICTLFIMYILPIVALSSSISFTLMIFVLIAFVCWLVGKSTRSNIS